MSIEGDSWAADVTAEPSPEASNNNLVSVTNVKAYCVTRLDRRANTANNGALQQRKQTTNYKAQQQRSIK